MDKMNYKLDDIDRKIIEELQKNPSIPINVLSKKIKLSSTPCWNRIKKLEENKILKKEYILDHKKINYPITVFLTLSIQNHTEIWLKNFQKIVNKYDQIIEVHRLTGSNSDYQITILSPSIEEYDKFQQILIKEIECTNMSSHISLQTIKKSNKYPLNFI